MPSLPANQTTAFAGPSSPLTWRVQSESGLYLKLPPEEVLDASGDEKPDAFLFADWVESTKRYPQLKRSRAYWHLAMLAWFVDPETGISDVAVEVLSGHDCQYPNIISYNIGRLVRAGEVALHPTIEANHRREAYRLMSWKTHDIRRLRSLDEGAAR
jgi:hypothetical protein